jgi:hypothetical protein
MKLAGYWQVSERAYSTYLGEFREVCSLYFFFSIEYYDCLVSTRSGDTGK